jgi:heme-degrading monooxygenase HmoA
VSAADPLSHSMVIASDYRVPDPQQVWPLLSRRRSALADIGAHHVLLYTSTQDQGRVLVTIGLRSPEPIVELLRSRVFFDWFDAVGVDDIPAVFAGQIVERFGFIDPSQRSVPGVVVAAISAVDDVAVVAAEIRAALPRFEAAGIRETRLFRAFDDSQEVMILQELDDEEQARRWIDQPDAAAPWIAGAGVGAYPPVFVGTFVDMMRIDE